MISRQEYSARQKIKHHYEPSTTIPGKCLWCTATPNNSCHQMDDADLVPDEEENRQMEDGLGGIPTIKICREYLKTTRTTLWGQAWDVKDKGRREEAARWLAREVDRVNAIRNMAMASSAPIELIVERARKMEG